MSQKVQVYKNRNRKSAAYNKFYVRAVYDEKPVTTEELANFIQTQCTVKKSDIKAVLDEMGGALKHFFEMGQKVRLDNVGTFKVGIVSAGSDTKAGCTAASVKSAHVIFTPETEAVASGETAVTRRATLVDGQPTAVEYQTKIYNHPVKMLKDVRFELAHDSEAVSAQESNQSTGG